MIDRMEDAARIERAMAGQSELEAIGSALLAPDALDEVAAIVEPRHFADERARTVLEALLKLRRDGRPATVDLVAPMVARQGVTADDLLRMMEAVPHGFHAGFYASRVLQSWMRREYSHRTTETRQALSAPDADVDALLHNHVRDVESILDTTRDDDEGRIDDLLLRTADAPPTERLKSGLISLDLLTDGGFVPGQLVCIGARPSVGKTAFCASPALAAATEGIPAVVFSLEMTAREMTCRFVNQTGAGGFRNSEAVNRLAALPLFVRESAGWTIDRVECESRRYVRRHSVRLIVIDYLSLIRPRDGRLPRWEAVSDISRSLKLLALQTDCVVIAAQQLSRDIEKRESRRPRMSDFRESGSIEQDSDILIALDRPVRSDYGDCTAATVHVLKNRSGETGELPMRFDPARTLFIDESDWS